MKNPDSLSWDERKTQRLAQEENAFDSDHYLCDFFEPEDIEHMWTSKSIWSRGKTKIFNGGHSEIETPRAEPVVPRGSEIRPFEIQTF